MADDEFELYDPGCRGGNQKGTARAAWRSEIASTCGVANCRCRTGRISASYALQATLPLLPAKQRRNHPADWMGRRDSRVTCPDPACRPIMRIDRSGERTLRHDDVSPIAWGVDGGHCRRPARPVLQTMRLRGDLAFANGVVRCIAEKAAHSSWVNGRTAMSQLSPKLAHPDASARCDCRNYPDRHSSHRG